MLSKKTSEKLEELLNRLIDEFDSPAHGQADAGRKENIKDIAIAINEISEAYNKVKSIEFLLGNNMLTKDPMFKELRERHGDSIQYDLESNEFYVKSDVSS